MTPSLHVKKQLAVDSDIKTLLGVVVGGLLQGKIISNIVRSLVAFKIIVHRPMTAATFTYIIYHVCKLALMINIYEIFGGKAIIYQQAFPMWFFFILRLVISLLEKTFLATIATH